MDLGGRGTVTEQLGPPPSQSADQQHAQREEKSQGFHPSAEGKEQIVASGTKPGLLRRSAGGDAHSELEGATPSMPIERAHCVPVNSVHAGSVRGQPDTN